ncbi:MAG: class I SAM-dependent methyltransferase [Armatimonadetes bacterium]|nr:class I SAM-dependent methyltransferase [Armatimonadota bacterium]
MSDQVSVDWWRRFFESPDSLELSFFPSDRETDSQVRGLVRMLKLTPQDRIADICCGYGRHLARLARRGMNVVGLDASEMMLDCAMAVFADLKVSAPLIRGDALNLPFADESLDVVVNLFNSFGYFLEDGQNETVLRETARVLKPGGRFLLDTRNRQFQILYAPYCQSHVTSTGKELILRCRYDQARSRMNSRWSLPDDPGQIVHEASIRLYGLDELRELMQAAGFEETGVYGTYQGEPFAGHHRQLLYVARKA